MSRFKALTLGLVEEGRFEAEIDFKIDLLIEADQQGNVLVGLSSGDLLEAVFNTFVDMTGELKGLLKGAGTFTMGRPAYGAWAYQE